MKAATRDSDPAPHRWAMISWAVAVALVLGPFLGFTLFKPGWTRLGAGLVTSLVVFLSVCSFGSVFVRAVSAVAEFLLVPTGSSTPYRHTYSRVDAMTAAGDHSGALRTLRMAAIDHPGDPEIRIRIGRLLRDHLNDFESAVRQLKQARDCLDSGGALDIALTWEIVELLENRIRAPLRAVPEFARLIDMYPGTRAAERAREALEQAKSLLRRP